MIQFRKPMHIPQPNGFSPAVFKKQAQCKMLAEIKELSTIHAPIPSPIPDKEESCIFSTETVKKRLRFSPLEKEKEPRLKKKHLRIIMQPTKIDYSNADSINTDKSINNSLLVYNMQTKENYNCLKLVPQLSVYRNKLHTHSKLEKLPHKRTNSKLHNLSIPLQKRVSSKESYFVDVNGKKLSLLRHMR